jgi:hypothetical protein
MEPRKNLSLSEAALVTGRSYWVLRSAVTSGALKATQFAAGGKIYIKPSDLDAYFDAHTVPPASAKEAA